jgi:MinD superfamily P-loop ATPase
MEEIPLIDRDKCQGCGLCVSVCACGALMIEDSVVRAVEVEECQWCTLCELVCPNNAISCPFEIILENDQT